MQCFVVDYFVVVMVDIGCFDKNGQIFVCYGIKGWLKGVFVVFVVDLKINKLFNVGKEIEFVDVCSMGLQVFVDWLVKWVV